MALRLVLVGIVAGLGLTFPSRSDVATWAYSAERWVNARLAELDSRVPVDEGAFVLAAEPIATAPSEPTPIVVSDEAFNAVVEEMVSTFVVDLPPASTAEPTLIAEAKPEVAPLAVEDVLVIAPPSTPVQSDPELAATTESTVGALMESLSATIVADLDEPAEAAETTESSLDAMMASLSATIVADLDAPTEPSDADRAFDLVMEEMAAGFAADLKTLATRDEAPQTTPAFDPFEVPEDLYAGEAYALNRAAEGISEAAPSTSTVSVPQQSEHRWAHAVRLTREAVYAWSSLLHGPAVVTIPR